MSSNQSKIEQLIFIIGFLMGFSVGGVFAFVLIRTQEVIAWWRNRVRPASASGEKEGK